MQKCHLLESVLSETEKVFLRYLNVSLQENNKKFDATTPRGFRISESLSRSAEKTHVAYLQNLDNKQGFVIRGNKAV